MRTHSADRSDRSGLLPRVCHLVVLAAAALTLAAFLIPTNGGHCGIDGNSPARFADMVGGTAHKPYVSRALLPAVIRGITFITPAQIRLDAGRFVGTHPLARGAFDTLGWSTDLAYQYLVASLLMYACLVGFAYYCAKLALTVSQIRGGPLVLPLLALLALYLLPPFFVYASYIYDPPQLLLFTASLYYLARLSIRRFVLLFLLTTLNKETSILLIPTCAIFCRTSLPKRQYASLLVVLVAGYVAIRVLLLAHLQHNPGVPLEFHLLDHTLSPRTFLKMFARSAYFALLLAMACWQWSRRPKFLKIALLCTLLPQVAISPFFGFVDEWRSYYEAYPIVFALGVNLVYLVRGKLVASQGQ